MGKNHEILTEKDTKKKVKKKKRILEAKLGREVSEDEVVDRALANFDLEDEKIQLLDGLFK